MPSQAHDDDAFDLPLWEPGPIVLAPGQTRKVTTGLCFEIPRGYGGLILGRSGNAFKRDLIALHVGLIDSSYRGEVKAYLCNFSQNTITIESGERICQMLVVKKTMRKLIQVGSLSKTKRGANGFGSSGK